MLNIVHGLVPTSTAQGILSGIAGILGIIKTTITNQGDFEELAEQCQKIGLTVWRATSGTPEHQINDVLFRALTDLKDSIDNLHASIEQKTKNNVVSKVFNVTINQETIAKWRIDLNRFLTLFNTELNISNNLKLDELLASFERFRMGATQNWNELQTPAQVPARPQVFVGRDDLVRSACQSLMAYHDVALIGPGGIGKTYIARAVLNDEEVAAKFLERRIFVRFDDISSSQITFGTFLDRIAKALGTSTLADSLNPIVKSLSSSATLLVLDNAETFLDAAVDAGRIADVIDGLGALPNVAILITTRTTVLPPNLRWVIIRVPTLDENDACKAFKMFYTPTIEPSLVIKLLSAVDFHPLSINLLAQAGVQNEWSPQDLVAAWDRQRFILLECGDGKIQSIAVTIETSIHSPSVVKFGDTIRYLLDVLAYLPQGLSKQKLLDIFPDVQDVETCADVLRKHSLAYLAGDFITLLAPIRLYFAKGSNTNIHKNPLLQRVQRYYENHHQDRSVIRTNDVNMEHTKESEQVITEARALFTEAGKAGSQFLVHLDWTIATAYCVQGNFVAAGKMYNSALEKSRTARFQPKSLNELLVASIKDGQGVVDIETGQPNGAKLCDAALQVFKRRSEPPLLVVPCLCRAAWAKIWDGRLDIARKYLEEGKALVDESQPEFFAMCVIGLAELNDLEGKHAEAKALRAQCLKLALTLSEGIIFSWCLAYHANYLAMEGDVSMARELMRPALPVAAKYPSSGSIDVPYLAGCTELIAGEFDKAKDYFQQATECGVLTEEFTCRARSERALGEIAIVKQDIKAASAHFQTVSELCKFSGTPEDCLYRHHASYRLNETFDGWTLYREGHPMFNV
ncbi:hypothetical protein H0H92_003756 [Tricholoma furcatifolium]|nr:hypothetical protein H0H92_003756 [Tricholoma furcatifolium]